MAKMTQSEIAQRIKAARDEGREPMPNGKSRVKPPANVSRLNAILARRERKF